MGGLNQSGKGQRQPPTPSQNTTQTKELIMAKSINVDKLLAHLAAQREECKKRLAWAKTDRERGFEDGYEKCLSNLAFALSTATE